MSLPSGEGEAFSADAIGYDGISSHDLSSLAFESFTAFPDAGGGECCIPID